MTSAAYRQDLAGRVRELLNRDPDNRLLSRGPRFRLSAEMIRDQSLAVSGLLSGKMYGPPVKPPQPSSGLSAAFGGGIDWTASARGRQVPSRSLHHLAALEPVSLDGDLRRPQPRGLHRAADADEHAASGPGHLERSGLHRGGPGTRAADRRAWGGATAEKVKFGFQLCLSRPATDAEVDRLVQLYESSRVPFAEDPKRAGELAANPLGPVPAGSDVVELAAWTVVGNVLLNLDEMLMKR